MEDFGEVFDPKNYASTGNASEGSASLTVGDTPDSSNAESAVAARCQLEKLTLDKIHGDRDLRTSLMDQFVLIGMRYWATFHESVSGVNEANPDEIIKAGDAIVEQSWLLWKRAMQKKVEEGGSLGFRLDDLPATLSSDNVRSIVSLMYPEKPNTGSYKWVGHQWETRVILSRWFQLKSGDTTPIPLPERISAEVDDKDWNWKSVSGVRLFALYVQQLFVDGIVQHKAFSWSLAADVFSQTTLKWNSLVNGMRTVHQVPGTRAMSTMEKKLALFPVRKFETEKKAKEYLNTHLLSKKKLQTLFCV